MSINEAIEVIEMFADDDGLVLLSRVKSILNKVEMPSVEIPSALSPFTQKANTKQPETINYKDMGLPPSPSTYYPTDPYGGPTFYC